MSQDRKRILIVDDEDPLRLLLKEIFHNAREDRYEVVGEASDGEEGLEKYKELKPDLVTMDFRMGDTDGVRALKDILNYDPEAKVVMVTSILDKELVSTVLKIGAKDYISKPFDEERIIFTLDHLLFDEG